MPELKPCPFCGSAASIEGEGWHAGAHTIIAVTCGNPECILGGPIPPEQWNRRTPEPMVLNPVTFCKHDLTAALARLKALEKEIATGVEWHKGDCPHCGGFGGDSGGPGSWTCGQCKGTGWVDLIPWEHRTRLKWTREIAAIRKDLEAS